MNLWFRILPPETGRAKLIRIVREVAEFHWLPPSLILSAVRTAGVCAARQECMWRARQETTYSLPQLGVFFGRDHATVLYGIRRHQLRNRVDESSKNGTEREPALADMPVENTLAA